MSDIQIKRALIAVYDKTGIVDFARALVDEFGIEIISTGGTARHLKDAGIPVTMVEEVTGFPEMLDGRVKTLHPKIHAAILADRDNPDHMRQLEQHGIKPIDMVVVNLYPFEKTVADPNCTLDQAIEMIDIGGPCMLRAAAKNSRHVHITWHPNHYEITLHCMRQGDIQTPRGPRREPQAHFGKTLAESKESERIGRATSSARIFSMTSRYDRRVADYLDSLEEMRQRDRHEFVSGLAQSYYLPEFFGGMTLKYGENPHQCAQVKPSSDHLRESLFGTCISATPLSFNNFVDGDAAAQLCRELTRAFGPRNYAPSGQIRLAGTGEVVVPREAGPDAHPVCVFVKHTNPCGCGESRDRVEAYRKAYLGDPVAAAGGVLCMNYPVTLEVAQAVMGSYASWGKDAGAAFFKLDVWIAPGFDDDAVRFIATPTERRKWGAECRLLAAGSMATPPDEKELDFRRVTGGILLQTQDLIGLNEDQWKVATKRKPTESELSDLRLAWLIAKHTKSNAISICRDGMLLGNGAGQMSRVKSCDLAIQLARENGHGDKLKGAVAAGDAFFPVPDGPQKLIDAGITSIIQPGGSNRDAETIALCDQHDIAMILTGTRHFKH